MAEAAVAPNESERIAALHALGILDTPRDERFDRVTRLAQRLFGVEIVLISLVDVNRQWFKSCIGLDAEQTPRADSFCAHAILSDDILVIPDARLDPRVVDNANVTGSPHIRFYAGKPLTGPTGHRLGTLCVMDTEPREFGAEDRAALAELGAIVEGQFELILLTDAVVDLHVAEARLRAIMDAAGEGIAMIDTEGLVVFVNPAAATSLGYEPAELVGRPMHETVHHSRPDGSPYPFEECPTCRMLTEGHAVQSSDEAYWRKDGTVVPIEYAASPIHDGEEIMGGVITWSDITERRELDLMKDQFVSSVSHEFRTPLTSIKGYVEALLDGDAGEVTEEQREFLEVVVRNTTRLTALISDLLLMSRLRAGKVDLATAPIDLVVIAIHALAELAPVAADNAVQLERDLGAASVVGDERHLGQAVTNLVSNAVKFTGPGGRVRVRTLSGDRDVVLEVTDDGVGIPADELSRIGTRFFRSSTAELTEGTGLGLAITQEIVESHGGALEVESEVGRGSTFRLRFPQPPG